MANVLRNAALANPVTLALAATGSGTRYDVGPGQPYTECDTVPWATLGPGDVVNIHYRAAPYVTKFGLRAQGTATDRVTVNGVTDASGNRPIINGAGAATASGSGAVFSATPAYGELLGVIVIKSAPTDTYASYWPGFIDIQNLRVQGAADGVAWTDKFGGAQVYASSAAVYVLQGHDIRVRNCELTDSGFGVFTMEAKDSTPNWHVEDIEFSSCRVWDNGVSGSYLEHNFYIQAIRPRIFGNFIGRTRTGSFGSSYKSRSSGELFAYNTVLASARAVDFVHAEGQTGVIDTDSQYGETWCYGNLIVNDFIAAGRGAAVPIHFGCDQSMEDGAAGTPTITDADLAPGSGGAGTGVQRYAKRNLFFYNNTYVNRATSAQSYRVHLFDLSLSGTALSPRTKVWEWDNAYHVEGTANFSWVEYAGAVNFMGGSKVFSSAAINAAHELADSAKYALLGAVPTGSVPIGFGSVANNDYMPVIGAPIDGSAIATPAGLPSTWVARAVEYMPNGFDAGGLVVRGAFSDTGAFDNVAGAPAPSPAPAPTPAVNTAPVLAAVLVDQAGTVGAAFSYTLPVGAFTDADGDVLTYSATGVPAGLTFNPATRVLSGMPSAAGTFTVNFVATDTSAATATDYITLTVVAAAPPPGATMAFLLQKADLSTASFANSNSLGAGGVAVRTDAGSTVGAAIAAAVAAAAPVGTDDALVAWAGTPTDLAHGAITYDANGAATAFVVRWPDGVTGAYAATTVSATHLGSVDAYTMTYVGTTTKTVTQPAVTRDGTGRVTVRPLRTVA